jgi:hypothetical protein
MDRINDIPTRNICDGGGSCKLVPVERQRERERERGGREREREDYEGISAGCCFIANKDYRVIVHLSPTPLARFEVYVVSQCRRKMHI